MIGRKTFQGGAKKMFSLREIIGPSDNNPVHAPASRAFRTVNGLWKNCDSHHRYVYLIKQLEYKFIFKWKVFQ